MIQTLSSRHGDARTDVGTALRIENVTKNFGTVEVLRGINIDVRDGEFLTLLGPSGSGKTTLLRIIAGFEHLTSGNILLGDTDLAVLPPSQRELGMVFQQYALFQHLTVAENIAFGLKQRRMSASQVKTRVDEMLEMVDLTHMAARRPGSLSGGQQQRVALARALAYGPKLLLMDEPLGALDRSLRIQLQQEIRRVHREVGTTIIYVTHDQEEALMLSDRVAILEGGILVGLDSADSLYRNPPNRFVARFFSDSNLFNGSAASASTGSRVLIRGQEGHHSSVVSGEVFAAVRPKKLVVNPAPGQCTWHLPARVSEAYSLGDLRQIELEIDGIGKVYAKEDIETSPDYELGQQVTVGFKADDVSLLTA